MATASDDDRSDAVIPTQPNAVGRSCDSEGRRNFDEEFNAVYDALHDLAHKVALRFFSGGPLTQQADDVAIETLTRLYVRWERANRSKTLEAWVIRTARNVCQEFARKEQRAHRPDPRRGTETTGGVEDRVATRDALMRAFRKLSKRERDVAVCRFVLGLTEAETAEMLGLPISKVKDATHRARRKLQAELRRGDEWDPSDAFSPESWGL